MNDSRSKKKIPTVESAKKIEKNKKKNEKTRSGSIKKEKKDKNESTPNNENRKKSKDNFDSNTNNSRMNQTSQEDRNFSKNLPEHDLSEFSQKQYAQLSQPLKLNFNYETRYKQLIADNDTLREENLNLRRNYEKEKIRTLNLEDKLNNNSTSTEIEILKEYNIDK